MPPKKYSGKEARAYVLSRRIIIVVADELCKKSRESYPCPNNKACKKAFENTESTIQAITTLRNQLWDVSVKNTLIICF